MTIDYALARPALVAAPVLRSGLRIEPLPLAGMILLRGSHADPALAAALRDLTGCDLPAQRRFTQAGEYSVCWMSPDELLILLPYAEAADAVARLDAALANVHHLAANVSDLRARFRISGAGAADLLAQGMPVDFSGFTVGDLRRSRLEQIAAMAAMTGPGQFDLFVMRSVAAHVWRWLNA